LQRSSTVLEQLPRINLKTFRNAGNVIDGNISFSPLNRTQVSSVDTAFVCEGLLAKPSRGAQPSHVLCQDVPQRSFVRPFHGRDFCGLTVLRRPLLSYIRYDASTMDSMKMPLPLNNKPVNREALRWLKEAKEPPEPHRLHLLVLADWGLENGAQGEWPSNHGPAVESQVHSLLGWDPKNVQTWLFNNPEGPDDPKEQEENLLRDLENAQSSKQAAAAVLSAIYSRQVSVLPALQPAASELR
jgi:hypothetical protein